MLNLKELLAKILDAVVNHFPEDEQRREFIENAGCAAIATSLGGVEAILSLSNSQLTLLANQVPFVGCMVELVAVKGQRNIEELSVEERGFLKDVYNITRIPSGETKERLVGLCELQIRREMPTYSSEQQKQIHSVLPPEYQEEMEWLLQKLPERPKLSAEELREKVMDDFFNPSQLSVKKRPDNHQFSISVTRNGVASWVDRQRALNAFDRVDRRDENSIQEECLER